MASFWGCTFSGVYYLVFTHTPGESYCRQLWSLLYLCDVFWEIIKQFPCLLIQGFTNLKYRSASTYKGPFCSWTNLQREQHPQTVSQSLPTLWTMRKMNAYLYLNWPRCILSSSPLPQQGLGHDAPARPRQSFAEGRRRWGVGAEAWCPAGTEGLGAVAWTGSCGSTGRGQQPPAAGWGSWRSFDAPTSIQSQTIRNWQ